MNARIAMLSVLLMLMGTTVGAWAADMEAWLDRSHIGEAETVQLTLEVQGQVSGRPDTTPLEADFDVLGISTGSRMSIVNGRTDARTTWTLTLSPRRSGTLTIPALRVGSLQSSPLSLQVSQAPAPAPGSNADILIETELAPRTPYVQGQVLYTVRLLHAVPVSSGQLSEPESDAALVQRLGEDREYALTRNGRRYQVIERRYALFPQNSGRLQLPAPVFDGEIPDNSRRRSSPFRRFFGNDPFMGGDLFDDLMTPSRRVRVRGEPVELDVRPRPDAAQGLHWLPAQQLTLKGEWQPDSAGIKAGEPVTLQLVLDAQGLTGGQLPDLLPAAVDGFRLYPDQPQRQTDAGDAGVTGHLQQKIAFIPERSGTLSVPAIEVRWWDTQADRERVATLPGRSFTVAPAADRPVRATPAPGPAAASAAAGRARSGTDVPAQAMQAQPAPPQRSAGARAWPWISAALACGWLVTLVFWWNRGRRARAAARRVLPATERASAAAARKQFLAACRSNDALAARRSVLAWAAAHWPEDPPHGLEALALRLHDVQAQQALAELDRALYREGGSWTGARLAQSLGQLPGRDAGAGNGRDVLAPLYPG